MPSSACTTPESAVTIRECSKKRTFYFPLNLVPYHHYNPLELPLGLGGNSLALRIVVKVAGGIVIPCVRVRQETTLQETFTLGAG